MIQNHYSDFKIAHFPGKLRSFVEGRIAAPIYVRIKPHLACAHGCGWCVYSTGFRTHDVPGHLVSGMHADMTNEHASIAPEKMYEVLEDLRDMGVKAVTYSGGGEPLQHPQIVGFAQRTLDYGIDLSLISNGQMLRKARAEVFGHSRWTRVSMDYQNAEQMAASRNVAPASFGVVMRNIEEFAKSKDAACTLGVNYIVTHENYRNLAEFARTLRNIGVNDLRVSPVWRTDFHEYHGVICDDVGDEISAAAGLSDENFHVYSSYDIDSPSYGNDRPSTKCFFMQMVPVVGADCKIWACHHKAFDNTGLIGSIEHQRFRDLWFSDEAKAVFDGLNPQVVCAGHQCANDGKNRAIMEYLSTEGDNFV